MLTNQASEAGINEMDDDHGSSARIHRNDDITVRATLLNFVLQLETSEEAIKRGETQLGSDSPAAQKQNKEFLKKRERE